MKKTIFLIILLLSCSFCFGGNFDVDLRFYLPSVLQNVTGNSSYLKFRENYETVEKVTNFQMEGRGSFASLGKFTFAYALGSSGYIESEIIDNHKYTYIGAILGCGVYFQPFIETTHSLSGVYVFIYPIYELPFYVIDDVKNKTAFKENDYRWKSAFDFGYSIVVFDIFSLSPYMRTIFGVTKENKVKNGLDFGFSLGIYFPYQ